MKKVLLVALVVLFTQSQAFALSLYPYFRPLDPSHLQPVGGALLDVNDLKYSEATGLLPLVTHSTKDGCMLPSIVCEDWTPLAIGGSAIAGQWTFIAAPLFNVIPMAQAVAYSLTPDSLPGLQRVFAPGPVSIDTGRPASPVTFSGGPAWEYKSATNKGYFRVFTGLALHF